MPAPLRGRAKLLAGSALRTQRDQTSNVIIGDWHHVGTRSSYIQPQFYKIFNPLQDGERETAFGVSSDLITNIVPVVLVVSYQQPNVESGCWFTVGRGDRKSPSRPVDGCREGSAGPPPHTSSTGCFRLDAHPVIDGVAQLLLASEVALGGLDRDVPEQELDLIQFAAGQVAEPRASAADMPHSACSALCRMPDYAESGQMSSESRLV